MIPLAKVSKLLSQWEYAESVYAYGGSDEDHMKADAIVFRLKPMLDFYASILLRYALIHAEGWHITTEDSYMDLARRLHEFGLLKADPGIVPASTVEVLAWADENDCDVSDILSRSINEGRADIAAACGAGVYDKPPAELALDYYRSNLRNFGITPWLEAIKQNPAYCEQVNPILLWLPKLISKPEPLAESASKVSMSGVDRMFKRFKPGAAPPADDYRYFVDWFTWAVGKAGEAAVLEIASKIMGVKPGAIEYCQKVVRDFSFQPGTHWKEVLGIDEDYPDPKAIRVAYRKQASIHHPDKGGSTVIMQRINVAKDEALMSMTQAWF